MRNKENRTKPIVPTGTAWYRPEQWQRLRETSSDVDTLEESYEEWLSVASKAVRDLEKLGLSVVQVDVDVEELIKWCKDRGLPVDASSRARYVADKVGRTKAIS